jgi:hypothetical protein
MTVMIERIDVLAGQMDLLVMRAKGRKGPAGGGKTGKSGRGSRGRAGAPMRRRRTR